MRLAKPDIEIKRELGPGYYRSVVMVYFQPLRVWINGHWIIGGKKVREAWKDYKNYES